MRYMTKNDFEVGDYVVRIYGERSGMKVGDIDIVTEIRDNGVKLKHYISGDGTHAFYNLVPFQYKLNFNKGE